MLRLDLSLTLLEINEGDYIGICNGKIVVSEDTKLDAIKGILSSVDVNEKEIITIIYGKDVNNDELTHIQDFIKENYPSLEMDVICGKQEVYSYILSVE